MPTSPMPNPRDYPDPIGYGVASADWWRARVHVNTSRRPPTQRSPTQIDREQIRERGLSLLGPERNLEGETTP